MLQEELKALAEPVLEKVKAHPFWAGLRDGSLPGEALAHFVEQDTGHLLPAYARALARTAAAAEQDAHTALLGRSITGTLEARDRLRGKYAELAEGLGLPGPADPVPEAGPATHAHCAFFNAASAASFAAGVGALLPMVWFNFQVSNDLLERHTPGSRYAKWIEAYHPGEGYGYAVRAFMGLADEIGETAAPAERARLVGHFGSGIRHEWAFAEAAWSRPDWPV
ncbi:TenA family transcriptional regulator [Streptomyces sp. NBC_01795]|uniref:TenA family protein n=1 Tax=Streptomyces sp. NBC_01795 TaxID=2975943 RepID=UPI002DDAE511|nr:TenA family transcriptional regulator [Streptomyces sp. NBC_01795]WSA95531.1 TenA family transcriptional regulator [Streptomyces sp. NBC_01795]